MRQSKLFASTLRDTPADAEISSHKLLLKAGFIRQLASGIYTYMPFGLKVLRKIETIIREEMDRTGAQELLMPALQPTELWKKSGRYTVYGPELIRLKDRHDREFALGPTHEEVITTLVKNEISSYKRLPVTLYQIQTKFRDERRPRFGLLRGREFVMKDAYSFDTDWEGLNHSYNQMYEAYKRIFERCGLDFRAVEADAGAIGGEGGSHEFMALTEIGEDTIAACTQCDYAANLEQAEARNLTDSDVENVLEIEKIHTPKQKTIDQLVEYLQIDHRHFIKTLIYNVDGNPLAVLVRGDHEVNEIKLQKVLGTDDVQMADSAMTIAAGAEIGFVGPVGLQIPLLLDSAVAQMKIGITGANEMDFHYKNVVPGRDFQFDQTADLRNVIEGDACPRCNDGVLRLFKGIEVGHVFKLGTQYSENLGARYLDLSGKEQVSVMGCYGIGVSRLLSAIVEQNHDETGIVWPTEIAPYHVQIVPVSAKNEMQMKIAEEIYDHLRNQGVEVLLDDRDERAGVKFKDAELIGIPIRIVVGKHAEDGNVEYVERENNAKQVVSKEEALSRILGNVD